MTQRLLAALRITLIQIVVTLVFSGLISLLEVEHWYRSFAIGGFFFAGNLLVLGVTWSFIFLKKNIALAFAASVIKFLILGVILFHLVVNMKVHWVFFALGGSTFILTALIEALLFNKPSDRLQRRSRRKVSE